MSTPQLARAVWKKSTRSNGNGGNNCVEVAILGTVAAVRDSKDQAGPVLSFDRAEWTAFINGVREHEFDIGT